MSNWSLETFLTKYDLTFHANCLLGDNLHEMSNHISKCLLKFSPSMLSIKWTWCYFSAHSFRWVVFSCQKFWFFSQCWVKFLADDIFKYFYFWKVGIAIFMQIVSLSGLFILCCHWQEIIYRYLESLVLWRNHYISSCGSDYFNKEKPQVYHFAPPQKVSRVLCYTIRNFECLSIRPSEHTNGHILGIFYTIPCIP